MPKIYVASLSDYNNGILHGAWIDSCQSLDEIRAEIAAMLAKSPTGNAEEYAIHDYDLDGAKIGEFENLEKVATLSANIAEYGTAFVVWYNHGDPSDDPGNWIVEFEDHYAGVHDSLADYAESVCDDSGVPEHFKNYIDYEADGARYGTIWRHMVASRKW